MEMPQKFCQSCSMPIDDPKLRGNEKNGALSDDYCHYCYKDGEFTSKESMEQMIDLCIPHEIEAGRYPDADTARKSMTEYFSQLKRWKK